MNAVLEVWSSSNQLILKTYLPMLIVLINYSVYVQLAMLKHLFRRGQLKREFCAQESRDHVTVRGSPASFRMTPSTSEDFSEIIFAGFWRVLGVFDQNEQHIRFPQLILRRISQSHLDH